MLYPYVMEITEIISKNVRHYRKEKGITQKRVAEICGVTIQQIQDVEAGRRKPSIDLVFRMASAFGVDSGKLLEQEEAPPQIKPLPFKSVLGMYARIPEATVKRLAKYSESDKEVWEAIEGTLDGIDEADRQSKG